MPEEVINDSTIVNSFATSLGIEDARIFGNTKEADAFLSGEPAASTDPADLVSIEEAKAKEEEDKKKRELKEKAEKEKLAKAAGTTEPKPDEKLTVDSLLGENTDDSLEGNDGELPSNRFEMIGRELFDQGIFTKQGDDDVPPTTGEALLDRFNKEKQLGATQWLEGFIGQHGSDYQELFQAIFVDGVKPEKYLPVHNQIQSLENLDMEKPENQELIYREYYKGLGWDSAKIEKKLKQATEYGDLEEDSKDFHKNLIQSNREKAEALSEQSKQELASQQKRDLDYKNALSSILTEAIKTKELSGIPVNDKQANEVFDFLYTKKYKISSTGEELTDFDKFILETKKPENLKDRVLLALLKLKKFDFSTIAKKAISTKAEGVFGSLVSKDSKNRDNQSSTATQTTTKNYFSNL